MSLLFGATAAGIWIAVTTESTGLRVAGIFVAVITGFVGIRDEVVAVVERRANDRRHEEHENKIDAVSNSTSSALTDLNIRFDSTGGTVARHDAQIQELWAQRSFTSSTQPSVSRTEAPQSQADEEEHPETDTGSHGC